MKIFVIIISSIMVVCFTAALVILAFTGFKLNFTEKAIDDQKIEVLAEINSLTVKSTSGKVNLIATDEQNIKAHLYGSTNVADENRLPKLVCEKTGNSYSIKIDYPTQVLFGFIFNKTTLDVYIPKAFQGDLFVDNMSGDVGVENLNLKSIKVNNMSGDIDVSSITAETADFSCMSGSVNINKLTADTNVSTASGRIVAKELNSRITDIDAMSGRIELTGKLGDLDARTASGDMDITYTEFNNNIKLDAMSGSISITLPESAQFALKAKSTSGSVRCDFPISLQKNESHYLEGKVGNGEKFVNITAVSGSVKIRK
jgi:lia operon protein LiaG